MALDAGAAAPGSTTAGKTIVFVTTADTDILTAGRALEELPPDFPHVMAFNPVYQDSSQPGEDLMAPNLTLAENRLRPLRVGRFELAGDAVTVEDRVEGVARSQAVAGAVHAAKPA